MALRTPSLFYALSPRLGKNVKDGSYTQKALAHVCSQGEKKSPRQSSGLLTVLLMAAGSSSQS